MKGDRRMGLGWLDADEYSKDNGVGFVAISERLGIQDQCCFGT